MKTASEKLPRMVEELLAHSRARLAAAKERADEIRAAQAALLVKAEKARTEGAVHHLKACGVDALTRAPFDGATSLRRTAALVAARAWLEGDFRTKPLLVLATDGGFGSGKSVAAAYCLLRATRTVSILAHRLADKETSFEELDPRLGLWVKAVEIRMSSRIAEGRAMALLDRATTVRWLVVDELRAEDLRGVGLERMEELLSERYARCRPTVITSNHSQERLKALLGGRLASRMAEGAVVVDPGQVDIRREKR